jgi:phage FluMu gp28-like protein
VRDCEFWTRHFLGVQINHEEEGQKIDGLEVLTYVIRYPSGNRIVALSSKPTNLRNRKGRIIVDEAAFMPDLQETMKAAMAILMWGGRVDILSTHNGVDSYFNEIVEDVKKGRRNYSLHQTSLDDALGDGLFKRICLVTGRPWSEDGERKWREELIADYGDDADEELFLVPSRSGGTYLPRGMVENAMEDIRVLRWEPPTTDFASWSDDRRTREMKDWLDQVVAPVLAGLDKKLLHALGEDFGRTVDLTVFAPVVMLQNLDRKVPFLVELRDTPFREQEQAFNFICDRLPRFFKAALDATGNGQYMAERAWQRYGEDCVEQVHLSTRWYSEHLPPLKKAFEDSEIVVPKDADVLQDLLAFKMIDGVPKLPDSKMRQKANTKRGRVTRHGDAGVAIALGYYASRQETSVYEYTSANKRRSGLGARSSYQGIGSQLKTRKGGLL